MALPFLAFGDMLYMLHNAVASKGLNQEAGAPCKRGGKHCPWQELGLITLLHMPWSLPDKLLVREIEGGL